MMDKEKLRRFLLPPGPILSLTLIGVMLLCGLLYYRSTKIQRFIEPTLAMSQPRFDFADRISKELNIQFAGDDFSGISFTADSILIDEPLIYNSTLSDVESTPIYKKVADIFLTILKDPKMRGYVDMIIISSKFVHGKDSALNQQKRTETQHKSEKILHALFESEPELEPYHGVYFGSTAMPVLRESGATRYVEFKIVPSDQLHIDVLLRLEKYAR